MDLQVKLIVEEAKYKNKFPLPDLPIEIIRYIFPSKVYVII